MSCLLVIIFNTNLISQSRVEIKNNFYDAESWILFEDYKEALPLYLTLAKIYPNNSNIKYRIGQCYINTPGEKDKALIYLEEAVKHINPNYKEGKFREIGAPYDALYYLANAYRINNQLDKALETYGLFRQNLDPKVYDSTIVKLQIQSCLNAKELMAMPLYIKEKNIGNFINENNSEFNPVISDNENMLVFSRITAFYDALFYSVKNNGEWSMPINMNGLLKIDRDIYPTSLSNDGKTLYLYSSEAYDGIIYSSRFENGNWYPLVKLNENINTKYWESHATISHDDKKLYFTSNRKGGYDGLDIYVSDRDSTGDWGPAKNLGPVINTPYNEETPFLSKDDKTLFFSSRGHFNMGGYDIFYSNLLENGDWSVPLNVGYPLNSTDDDVFFRALNDGYAGYLAKYSPDGFGKQDIYKIEIFSEDHPRKFFLRGMVKVADLVKNANDSVRVSAMNIKNPNQTIVVYSNPKTGEYEFQLPHGNFEVTYEAKGGEIVKRNIDLPISYPSDSFVLPGTVLPKTDFVADLNVGRNKSISVTRGDSILFPLRVEPGSVLVVEKWLGDSLLGSEEFIITDSTFNYKSVPLPGDNKIVFKLTDRFNNTTTTDVYISREKGVITQPITRPEYSHIIAEKQLAAVVEMLKNRDNEKLRKIIAGAFFGNKQFGKIDDLISFLKEEAAKSDINSEDVDKLALKIAVMDNVLTQAAVDLMSKQSEGDLKKILENLDIYKENLTSWTDLQEYISTKTEGKISPEDLNKIAADVLSDTDPSISSLREKILTISNNSVSGNIIRQAIAATDNNKIKNADQWLLSVYNESKKQGLTDNQIADIFVALSSVPTDDVEEFKRSLIQHAQEPFLAWLKSLDLKLEKIRTPKDLIQYILANSDKGIYTKESFLKALSNLILSKDIPSESIISQTIPDQNRLWILWIVLGAGTIFIFIIFRKKRKNNNKT
jgi:tetratricopeptide (TPR) repeat protein